MFDNGKIIKITDTKNDFEISYYYNPDGTLRKFASKIGTFASKNDSVVHVYNSNKTNIMRSIKYTEGVKIITDYTYDDKENLLKGHLGCLSLWATHSGMLYIAEIEYFNKNNIIRSVSTNSQTYTSFYTYDVNGLPSSFKRSPKPYGDIEESGIITYSCD